MKFAKHSGRVYSCCATAILAVALFAAANAFAQVPIEKTIHSFLGSGTTFDGINPFGNLIADAGGNLYGTTVFARTGEGTVFQLSPPASSSGDWTETILHTFPTGTSDGTEPRGTLLMDKKGNLFGTTVSSFNGDGLVFELSPPATVGGTWAETVLYNFPLYLSRGIIPGPDLVMDVDGNLYGTTDRGGVGQNCPNGTVAGCGTVFELHAPAAPGGAWKQHVVDSFGMSGDDLFRPSTLVLHGSTFYGTASNSGGGAVFQLTRDHGVWTRILLHDFSADDVSSPDVVTFDSAGNIYGNANTGGGNCLNGCGGVFKLTSPAIASAPWTETTLYQFTGGVDGNTAMGQLVFDRSGNLYGVAQLGGLKNRVTQDNGTVFELSPPAVSGSAWTERTLHEFGGFHYNDGSEPLGGLVFVRGKFYGTTSRGGIQGYGSVFSVTIAP